MTASPHVLSGPSTAPSSGRAPASLVVLLHGVGSNGDDLIGLVPALAPALPDAAFHAPDGMDDFDQAPAGLGRQWFSLSDFGGGGRASLAERARSALDVYIDGLLSAYGLDPARLALLGFSQGAMMALHVGLRRARPPAAVLAYSGMLLGSDRVPPAAPDAAPVFLCHGTADPVVPAACLSQAENALTRAGYRVETLLRPGLGHGIDPEGIAAGAAFLVARLAPG